MLTPGFCHATGYGWTSSDGWHMYGSYVYAAGEASRYGNSLTYAERIMDHDSWPAGGWLDGDEACLKVDCGAGTVSLRHRRHGKTFTLGGLDGTVAEWFPHVCMFDKGNSVEVQPLSTAAYDAFLQ